MMNMEERGLSRDREREGKRCYFANRRELCIC